VTTFFVWLDWSGSDKASYGCCDYCSVDSRHSSGCQVTLPVLKQRLLILNWVCSVARALDCKESSKIDEAMDIIEELHDSDQQSVVFCTFNAPLFEIKRRCAGAGSFECDVIYGGADSSGLDEKFQQGRRRCFASTSAMSEGA